MWLICPCIIACIVAETNYIVALIPYSGATEDGARISISIMFLEIWTRIVRVGVVPKIKTVIISHNAVNNTAADSMRTVCVPPMEITVSPRQLKLEYLRS